MCTPFNLYFCSKCKQEQQHSAQHLAGKSLHVVPILCKAQQSQCGSTYNGPVNLQYPECVPDHFQN